MAEKELEDYVKTQRSLGVSTHEIRKSLLNAGYADDDFRELLERHEKKQNVKNDFSFNPKHLLGFNIIMIIVVAGFFAYHNYDYNRKLNLLSEEYRQSLNSINSTLGMQSDSFRNDLSLLDSSVRNELQLAKNSIETAKNDINRNIQSYNYQSISRDAALSDSIQKTSNRSLSELSIFQEELKTVKDSTADFSTVIPLALSSAVTIGKKGNGYFTTAGSGVLINNEGYIITNNHVIDSIGSISVRTYDKGDFTATVIGKDDDWDIAVIKVISDRKDFDFLNFGDSSKVAIGEPVIAIGNPVGLESTVTQGIISNTQRLIIGKRNIYYFQTDVAINAGNSGGPLVSKNGEIIGIATLKYAQSGAEGLSFALRSNDVNAVVLGILQKE